MCSSKIKNVSSVILSLSSGQGSYQLPNDALLDKVNKITGITALYAYDDAVGPNGQTLLDYATFKSGYLTLVDSKNNECVQTIPLTKLAPQTSQGYSIDPLEFDVKDIAISKCKINFGSTGTITNSMNLILLFSYE